MIILGKKINTFNDIVDLAIEELTYDDTYVDECTGKLETIDDIDELHDFFCDGVSQDDYDEFNNLLEQNRESFDGIEIDCSDPYEEARRYYYSTRGC